jgi:hypothetical protein
MNDVERLAELRSKLLRIAGHKNLSARQEEYGEQLVLEIIRIEGVDGKKHLKGN